jgi:hypothetical protein
MGVALMDVGADRSIVAVARGEAAGDEEETDVETVEGAVDASSENDVTDSAEGEAAPDSDTVGDQGTESADQ